jgi:hypothetical protein
MRSAARAHLQSSAWSQPALAGRRQNRKQPSVLPKEESGLSDRIAPDAWLTVRVRRLHNTKHLSV